jgi:hypothetical protein
VPVNTLGEECDFSALRIYEGQKLPGVNCDSVVSGRACNSQLPAVDAFRDECACGAIDQRSLAELNRENEGSRKPSLAERIAMGPVVVEDIRRRAEHRGASTGAGCSVVVTERGPASGRRSIRGRGARQP